MAGRRSGDQRRWWLIVAAVMAFVVSGVYVGFRQLLVPEPTPTRPPSPSQSSAAAGPTISTAPDPEVVRPAGGPLLPGAGSGDVFVQSATAIYRIELATGRVTRTPTPVLLEFASFVAGPGWVVFKTVDADYGVVVKNDSPAAPLPVGLLPNGRLYPAPNGDLWLLPEEPTGGIRVVARVSIEGYSVNGETIEVPDEFGILASDGAEFLILPSAGKVYQVRPTGPRLLTSGELIAVGRRFLLVWDCDHQARCHPYRLDRANRQRTAIRAARDTILRLYQGDIANAADSGGDLSPDGTHAALGIPLGQAGGWPLAILNLASGQTHTLPGSLTDLNGNTQIAWTPNSRWLLAITDHQMRAFDTKTNTTFTDEQLMHLTMAGVGN